jgi:hypothetical protein
VISIMVVASPAQESFVDSIHYNTP